MRPNARWDAVLFDLDGTLADTVELILRCYRHTMRTHLGRELPDERWLATIGTRLVEQLQAFARSEEEAVRMLETYESHQRSVHDELMEAFPGAARVVEALSEEGVPLAVVTSKRREMALRTVEACGLTPHFPVLVAGDDVEHGKPHPEPVRRALAELGVRAGRSVLFVGDSPYDVRAGASAGVRTAAVLWGPYGLEELEEAAPDFLLADAGDLAALVS